MKTMSFFRLLFIVLAVGGGLSTGAHAQEILFSLDITEEPVGTGDEVLVRIFDSDQMGGFTYLYPDTVADFSSQVLFAQSMIGENIVFSFGIYRPSEGKVYWEESNQRSSVVPDSGMVTTLPGYVLGELDPGHTVSSSVASSPTSQKSQAQANEKPKEGGDIPSSSSSLGGPFATGTYLPMPDLLSPSNPAFEVAIDPVLDWQFGGTSGNYQFDYQIGNDLPGNVAKMAPVVVVYDTEADLKNTPLLEEEKYYWRVRGCDVGTQLLCSPWTEMWQFTTVFDLQADGNIDLLSPQDGEELGTTTPIFTWDLSGNYQNQGDIHFYVCDASTSSSACLASEALFTVDPETVGVNDRESIALPVTGLTSLADTSSFYWRIERNWNGNVDPGTVGYFSIETAGPGVPEVPGLAYPSAGEALVSLNPVLSWGSVENAAYYEYQHGFYADVLTEASPAPINVGSNTNTSDPGNTPTSLDYSTTYRWRVRACNLGVCSAWSTPRVFTTLYPPISITYPGTGTQATTLDVGWTYDSNLGGPFEEFAVEWSTGKLSNPEGRIDNIPGSQLHAVLSQLPASSEVNWHVQGRGGDVWQAFSSDSGFLTGSGHGPISLLTPDGSVEIEPSYPAPPTFDWDDGTGGYQQFEVRVGQSHLSTYEWQTFSVYNGMITSFTWTPLLYDANYGWQVRARIGGVWEAWTDAVYFDTVADPGAPTAITLDSPRNGSVVFSEYPSYSWALDRAYDELEWYLCSGVTCDAGASNIVQSVIPLPDSATTHQQSIYEAPLGDSLSYAWMVRGKVDTLWTNSSVFTFTVDLDSTGGQTAPPPGPTQFTYPFEYSEDNPVLMPTHFTAGWRPVYEASLYRYQVHGSVAWPLEVEVTEQSYAPVENLAQGSDQYMRVQACNNNGCSSWSETRHIKIKDYGVPAPGTPTLAGPADNAINTILDVPLSWYEASGTVPESYQYQIATDGSFADAQIYSSPYTLVESHANEEQKTYFWRVRACNAEGENCSPWSSDIMVANGWVFTTGFYNGPQTFPPLFLNTPTDGATTSATPTLVWSGDPNSNLSSLQSELSIATDPLHTAETIVFQGYEYVPSGRVVSMEIPALNTQTTYYWRARWCSLSECGYWSPVWSFTTEANDVQRYYYLSDHLGSTRVVFNDEGQVNDFSDYYPFGLEMPGRSTQSGTKALENYTGHELDKETGLHYANARYYDAVTGRWGVRDPLGDSYPQNSAYSYVLNDPISKVDLDGRDVTCVTREHCNQLANDINSAHSGHDGDTNITVEEYREQVDVSNFDLLRPSTWFGKGSKTTKTVTKYRLSTSDSSFDWAQDKFTLAVYDVINTNEVSFSVKYVPGDTDLSGWPVHASAFDSQARADIGLGGGLIRISSDGNRLGEPNGVVALHELIGHGHPVGANYAIGVNNHYQNLLGYRLKAGRGSDQPGYLGTGITILNLYFKMEK